MTDRPSDAALWRSVQKALSDAVLPALPTGHARDVARQLTGVAAFALRRGDDPTPLRGRQLAGAVGVDVDSPWATIAGAASAVLVAPFRGSGGEDPQADDGGARRQEVRRLLLGFLAEDAAAAQPLLDTFARHGDPVGDPGEAASSATPVAEAAALEAWLSGRGDGPVRITAATAMSGGHSRRMLDVRTETAAGPQALVVRVEQGGVFGTDGVSEAAIMMALDGAGVATAPILASEPTGDVLGHPFFVMARVAGADAADPIAVAAYLHELHRLHQVPVAAVERGFAAVPADPAAGVAAVIDHWEGIYRASVEAPIPLLDEAAAWLRRHLQPSGALAVVHGDPGPGNFLYLDGKVTALTDWEFTHIGDPAEDWSYLAALRGARLHDEATWRQLIADTVGVSYDPATWASWTVLNVFKGACANLTAARVFNDGTSEWPNLLAVGTAVHLRFVRRLADLIG